MDRERAARPWPGEWSGRDPARPGGLQATRAADDPFWSWVGEDGDPRAERHGAQVDRLAADVDLHTRLALLRFTGREYDQFQAELVRYGLDVMTGWLRTGKIFVKMREFDMPVPSPPDGALDRDAQDELAGETVTVALTNFHHRVLLKGKWDPQRGARLTTFFVGRCKIEFANIYRAWLRRETRQGEMIDPTESGSVIELCDTTQGPEFVAVARSHVRRGVRAIDDPRVHHALDLIARGHTLSEIGADMSISEKAVERLLANNRTRLDRRGIK